MSQAQPKYVKVINGCAETILIYIWYRKTPKPTRRRRTKYILRPGKVTPPLPWNRLVGGKGFESWRTKECITVDELPDEDRFAQIVNISEEPLSIEVAPETEARKREKTTVTVAPRERSRTLDLTSVTEPGRLNQLIQEKKILLKPHYEIGPTTGRRGAVASYVGESVYICYECGGPIIFRGSPPRPVHI